MTEIQDRASFDLIRYANCWEDASILVDALSPRRGGRFASIASGGDNTFALLLLDPELILAADLSPVQIAVVELKRAAFLQLEYEEMLALLGFHESRTRAQTLARLDLPEPARAYWQRNTAALEGGVIHAGKFEHYFRIFRQRVLPLIHDRDEIAELLREKPIDERRRFYSERWDTLRWRLVFRIFFSRFVLGRMGRDPEFFRFVEGSVASRILDRVRYALTELPTHDNPYMRYILDGSFGETLPLYARREHFTTIRDRLGALQLYTGSLDDAVVEDGGRFDAFNLSDIFEYMDPTLFESVARTLVERSDAGALLAYWNMLVPRSIAALLPASVEHLAERSRALFAEDRAFFYKSFHVDRVTG